VKVGRSEQAGEGTPAVLINATPSQCCVVTIHCTQTMHNLIAEQAVRQNDDECHASHCEPSPEVLMEC